MLILARKINQKIIITTKSGEVIKIDFLGMHNATQCKIGIDADKDVAIFREEIYHEGQESLAK